MSKRQCISLSVANANISNLFNDFSTDGCFNSKFLLVQILLSISLGTSIGISTIDT